MSAMPTLVWHCAVCSPLMCQSRSHELLQMSWEYSTAATAPVVIAQQTLADFQVATFDMNARNTVRLSCRSCFVIVVVVLNACI